MTKCDHQVGFDITSGFIEESEIIEIVKFEVDEFRAKRAKVVGSGVVHIKTGKTIYIEDHRPSKFLTQEFFFEGPLFKHCPLCGEAIDWDSLKEKIDKDYGYNDNT